MSGKPSVVVASAMGATLRRRGVDAAGRLRRGVGPLARAGRAWRVRLPGRGARRLPSRGPARRGLRWLRWRVLGAGGHGAYAEVAASDADPEQLADPDVVLVHDDPAVAVLHDGIPALEGRLGGEGHDLATEVLGLVGGAVQSGLDARRGPRPEGGDLLTTRPDQGDRVGHDGTGDEGAQPGPLGLHPAHERAAHAVACRVDEGALVGGVGDDLLAGVGRCRGPPVGDEVEERRVDVVPDGADDGSAGLGDRTDHRLVGEGKQLLERTSATSDDDDVDGRQGVELAERLEDLGDGRRALHGDLTDLEDDGGPTAPGVLDDILLGRGVASGDEADAVREEGDRSLASRVEDALGSERALEDLDAGEEVADADGTDLACLELE